MSQSAIHYGVHVASIVPLFNGSFPGTWIDRHDIRLSDQVDSGTFTGLKTPGPWHRSPEHLAQTSFHFNSVCFIIIVAIGRCLDLHAESNQQKTIVMGDCRLRYSPWPIASLTHPAHARARAQLAAKVENQPPGGRRPMRWLLKSWAGRSGFGKLQGWSEHQIRHLANRKCPILTSSISKTSKAGSEGNYVNDFQRL
jgi:hypothetical protein